jgi:hypothetical protein
VENGVKDLVHEDIEFAGEYGREFFKIFFGEVFISFYSFERLIGNKLILGTVELTGTFVEDGEVIVGID